MKYDGKALIVKKQRFVSSLKTNEKEDKTIKKVLASENPFIPYLTPLILILILCSHSAKDNNTKISLLLESLVV